MPSDEKTLVNLRGRPEYRKALDRLARKTGASNLGQLVELAIRQLGERHGVTMPARIRPHGTNRYTAE